MVNILILLLILLILAMIIVSYRQYSLRNQIRNRINYGFSENFINNELDLSAGDYGLSGQHRFYFLLNEFLQTTNGKITIFIFGMAFSGVAAFILGKNLASIMTISGLGGLLLLAFGILLVINYRKQRELAIKSELPNTLQTISAIMEGGLAFESATQHVVRESDPKHPLIFELQVMLESMQRGRRRNEALNLWAQRSNVVAVTDVVAGLIQADQTGASLGTVLKHHGQKLLRENEAEIQRRAERLPVKMLFPMAFMILPSVIIIAAGPSMVRVFQIISDIMKRA